jgi:hypothetical protein
VSQPKPADVTVATDWNKIRSWANGQKIPTTAVNNVYALDQARLQSGYYPMSNAERTRAILAAANMNYNTALPTDNPGPSDIWGNTIRNIQGIATGLMPTRLASNIFDTLKTSVEDITHPGQFAKNGGLAGALTGSALSWIPGAYDLGTIMKSGGITKGLEKLAEQPVTLLLDVMPALKAADLGAGAVAADTATGQALADRLGLAPKALGQKGLVRIAGKAIGQIPVTGNGLLTDQLGRAVLDADGHPIIGRKTLSQRASESAWAKGTGKALSYAAHSLASISNSHTLKYRALVGDLQKQVAKLTPDTVDRATGEVTRKGTLSIFNEAMHSGRTSEDLLNAPDIPLEVKEAIKAYQPWEEWHKEYMLNSGQIVPVAHPDGTVSFYERTRGEKLSAMSRKADIALERANAASAAVDEINGVASQAEAQFAPLRDEMMTIAHNYLSKLAVQAGKTDVYLAVAQRLMGSGGLLDRMDKAFAAGDWREFTNAAKDANRVLKSKQIVGREEVRRIDTVAGHKAIINKGGAETAFKGLKPNHVRLFKPESAGLETEEGWTTSYQAAVREANGGAVYKVNIPRGKLWWMKDDDGSVGGKMSDADISDIIDKQKQGLDPEARPISLRPPTTAVRVPSIEGWEGDPNLVRLKELIQHSYEFGKFRSEQVAKYKRAWEGSSEASRATSARALSEKAGRAVNEFMRASRREVPAEYRDVVLNRFMHNFMASDDKEIMLQKGAEYLRSKKNSKGEQLIDEQRIQRMVRSDPRRLYELVVALADPTFKDPFLPMMNPEDHALFMNDALKETESLRARGEVPMYVPTTGARFATSPYLTDDHIYVNPVRYPTISSSFTKAMDLSSTVNDVMLGVTKATKEALGKDATLSFWDDTIKPMLWKGSDLKNTVYGYHQVELEGETAATMPGAIDALIEREYGHVPFNVKDLIDLDPEHVGLDPNETYYIPKVMKDQMEGLVGKGQFPLNGIWDKSTKVFKYAILGLSPRYTAHILFGGTMLLALRINPGSFAMIGDAAKMVKDFHAGKLDEQTSSVFQGSTQYGTPDQNFHFSGGRSMGNLALQEWLARKGIDHRVATAAQWAEAAANINFRFTNHISDMQRAIAYLDGQKHAGTHGWINDPITGEKVELTAERAHWEGMRAAERVMGNLQAMTPLERSVARKIMPFYGWTKHILKYVLTYPVDHPWRTSFLSVLSTQNTDSFASGLDARMQLLFFLGSPDSSGNVTAVDVRALDPFRDVANYATLSGWISAMNPIITAPFAAIDPSIIYGSNTLHPQVDYSSLYGTNVAQPSGGWLSAIEQEIPEVGALDSALGFSAQARAIKREGGSAALKDTLSSLGFPWTPQKLNLQQISAKHEVDRYNQAKNDALTAWQTGDFSALLKYPGTVPDPLQSGYNITPLVLYRQYQRAQKAYPGLPPSETIASLPAPAL